MIARNSFVVMASQAASAILGVFGLFAISKIWGQHAPGIMGIVWFGLSFVGTFSFITNMGFDVAHVKKVSEGKDLGTCNGTYIAIKLILTGLLVASVLATIFLWKHVLGHATFYDSTRESVIYIFTGYYAFFSLAQIPIMTLNSLKKNVIGQLTIMTETVLRVSLFMVVLLAGISGAILVTDYGSEIIDMPATYTWPSFLEPLQTFLATHVIGAMSFAYAFSAMVMFLVGFIFLRRFPISRPSMEYMRMYTKFAIPMMVPVIFTLIVGYMDKVILGYYWTATEVGYYFAVYRISSFITLIPAAIGIVLYPTISTMYSERKIRVKARKRKIARLVKDAERYTSMVTVPMVVIICVFAVPLIDIGLNSSFRPGAFSLQILTVSSFIGTMFLPLHCLVLGADRPGMIAKSYLMAGISNIAANLLFIPRNGLLSPLGISGPSGAAMAIVVYACVMFICLYSYSRKIIRHELIDRRIWLHIAAGLLSGALIWKMGSYFDPIHWYTLIGLSVAGLGTYLALLFLMREFRRRELDFFLNTMNPASLLRYVKDEVRNKKE